MNREEFSNFPCINLFICLTNTSFFDLKQTQKTFREDYPIENAENTNDNQNIK